MSGLVLASASASRARLLEAAGVAFVVAPASVDEDSVKTSLLAQNTAHGAVADVLAEQKALQISRQRSGALVLGADQVLVFENELVSKSPDLAAAAGLLKRLRGKCHSLINAAVLAKDGAPIWRFSSRSELTMRNFSDEFLDTYLAEEGEALLSGVGCYRLEGAGIQLFSQIQGDYFSILGLPLLPLLSALRDQGVIAA